MAFPTTTTTCRGCGGTADGRRPGRVLETRRTRRIRDEQALGLCRKCCEDWHDESITLFCQDDGTSHEARLREHDDLPHACGAVVTVRAARLFEEAITSHARTAFGCPACGGTLDTSPPGEGEED